MLQKAAVTYVPPPGWGEFGWKYIPKAERVCRSCGQQIKKMEDVFEVRRVFPSSKTQLLCHGCRSQTPTPDQRS